MTKGKGLWSQVSPVSLSWGLPRRQRWPQRDTWTSGVKMIPGALKTEQAVRGLKEAGRRAWLGRCCPAGELLWGDASDFSFRPSMPCWHGV